MTVFVQPRELLTLRETAARLHLSEKTVRRHVARGELPAVKLGALIRIDPDDLEAWLEQRLITRGET